MKTELSDLIPVYGLLKTIKKIDSHPRQRESISDALESVIDRTYVAGVSLLNAGYLTVAGYYFSQALN